MFDLKKISTLPPKHSPDKEEIKEEVKELQKRLSDLQDIIFACKKKSVLIIIQGMDASGKDGAVKHCFSGVNPAGIRVYAFKKPSVEEEAHDFLWRVHNACPPKGMIHVFNRSHYEEILVPAIFKTLPTSVINKRYKMINQFENMLMANDTLILKFYLHVSKEYQLKNMEERRNTLSKNWKYDPNDAITIEKRNTFIKVYENIFEKSGKAAQWNIIPADKNYFKEYSILKIVVKELEKLNLKYPAAEK